MTQRPPDHHTILEDAWDQVVGGMDWLKSVFCGEFADNRPLSSVVADMLVSFIPGVVIVTSARDAVAVVLRMATCPEKRGELMEWVLLCACLITIALPVAMAAGGAVAVGVGAVVGGIAGSELGAAMRAVMLMLIKEATKLVELVQFLQKFIKGDILKFLRAINFAKYEKPLLLALNKITGKLLELVRAICTHLEGLQYFDNVKATIAKLEEWQRRFYAVQQEGLTQVPKALSELQLRLEKVLAQTAPKEAHTVAAGVLATKTTAAVPATQRVRDTPSKIFPKAEEKLAAASPAAAKKTGQKPKLKSVARAKLVSTTPVKDTPTPVKPPDDGANTKKQKVVDAAVAADRERITRLSDEARKAEKNGNKALADAKINEAREILKPYLPKNPGDTWDAIVKRLDVSSPKDKAVFWSGDPKIAQKFAEGMGGVTLETTAGGRIIDRWDDVNKGYAWDSRYGSPPYGRDLWGAVSEKYAEGATGVVNSVQMPEKLWDPGTLWHNVEKSIISEKLLTREVSDLHVYTVYKVGEFMPLSRKHVDSLLKIEGGAPL